jgi:ABC-type Mn2+/Zn2+ transport system permease subunit
MGAVVSMLGMYFSVLFDLPTGATIVCTFGVVLALMACLRPLVRRPVS